MVWLGKEFMIQSMRQSWGFILAALEGSAECSLRQDHHTLRAAQDRNQCEAPHEPVKLKPQNSSWLSAGFDILGTVCRAILYVDPPPCNRDWGIMVLSYSRIRINSYHTLLRGGGPRTLSYTFWMPVKSP